MPGAPLTPPSLLTNVYRIVYLHFFLSPLCHTLLQSIIHETPAAWLTGSTVSCSGFVLEPAVSGTRQFLASFLTEDPLQPHATKASVHVPSVHLALLRASSAVLPLHASPAHWLVQLDAQYETWHSYLYRTGILHSQIHLLGQPSPPGPPAHQLLWLEVYQ